jgi:hypothetical protein
MVGRKMTEIELRDLIVRMSENMRNLSGMDRIHMHEKISNLKKVEQYLRNPSLFVKEYSENKRYCMAFNCNACVSSGSRSHSVSKQHLKFIADHTRHVCTVELKNSLEGHVLVKKGVNVASAFPCFCKKHDDILFASFEKRNFNASYEQIYDCTFRALCSQYFLLKNFKDLPISLDSMLERSVGLSVSSQGYVNDLLVQEQMRDHGFLYDEYPRFKKSGLSYIVLEVSKLPMAATGIWFPMSEVKGDKIPDVVGRRHGFIYYVFTEGTSSYIVIATVRSPCGIEKNILGQFNISDMSVLDYLLSTFLQNNHSIYIDPQWYYSRNNTFKQDLDDLLWCPIDTKATGTEITIIQGILKHFNVSLCKVKAYNI